MIYSSIIEFTTRLKNASSIQSAFQRNLSNDTRFLNNFFDATGNAAAQQVILNNAVNTASTNAIKYAEESHGAARSVQGFVNAQIAAHQATTNYSTAIKSFGVKLGGIMSNMLAMYAVTKVIQLTAKTINSLIHAEEKAAEKAEQASARIKDINSAYNKSKQVVNEVAETYERLSKGIDKATNTNLSLSDENYKEFLEINNQLAETFPELVQGIDDNGNAILNLGTKGKSAASELQEFLQIQKDISNYKISQEIDDIFPDVVNKIKKSKENQLAYNNEITAQDEYRETINGLAINGIDIETEISFSGDMNNRAVKALENIYLSAILSLKENLSNERLVELDPYDLFNLEKISSLDGTVTGNLNFNFDTLMLTKDEKIRLNNEIKAQAKVIGEQLNDTMKEAFQEEKLNSQVAELAWKDFIPKLISTVESKSSFNELDEVGQQLALKLVGGLQSSTALEMDKNNPYDYILKNIILSLQGLSDADNANLSEAYSKLFSLDASKMSIDDYKQQVKGLINTIAALLGKEPIEIKTALGFSNLDSLKEDTRNVNIEFTSKSKSEMLSTVNELSAGFESLRKISDEVASKNPFNFSILDDSLFKDTFGNLGNSYNDFIDKISSSPKDIEACQAALDDLLAAWLNSQNIFDGLSEDTASLTAALLDQMGVANAEAVVANALAQKHALLSAEKNFSAVTSKTLSQATNQDIINFISASDATDIAKQSIIQYYLSKEFAAGLVLDTSSDVEQLINLVSALSGATGALEIYYNALNGTLNYADISGMSGSDGQYIKQMAVVQANAELEKIKSRTSANIVKPKLRGGAKGGSINSGGDEKHKKEDTKKEFDWISRMFDQINKKREELLAGANSGYISYLGINQKDLDRAKELIDLNNTLKNSMSASSTTGIASLSSTVDSNVIELNRIANRAEMSLSELYEFIFSGADSESRSSYLSQLIELDKLALEQYEKVIPEYQKKYEEAASKLSDEMRFKVENGGIDIQTLNGNEAENVQTAIDAYDALQNKQKDQSNAFEQFNSDTETYHENNIKAIDAECDKIQQSINLLKAQINYMETSGEVVNATTYERLIIKNQQMMKLLEKQIAERKAELETLIALGLDDGDEKYLELETKIAECEASMWDLASAQEEYNDKIRQLPIENMQKILNMYEDIANALQDYSDMVEASGKKLDAEYYQTQIKNGIKTISQYKEQADLIRDVMDEYEVGSDKYMDMYDKLQDVNSSISNIVKNMHEWNKELLALPINAINDQLTGLNEALNSFQDIQSDHETVINAVTDAINEQIDALEEQRDIETEAAQNEIDALQEKLDLLQKQNDERKLQLALEQAKYDLERAQNQKSNQVVRDGELIWEANQDDIRSAGESVADAQYDILTHELEKQKEALEENLSLIEERYQKQIDQLTEMSEKWSKIKSDAEAAANAAIANQYLGEGWKDKVTSGNDKDIYEAFQNNFNTNHQMVSKYEKQIQSTEQIYNLLNSYITAYQAGTLSYEQAMASIKALLSQMNQDMSANQSLQNVLDYLGKVNGTNADADSVLAGIQAQLKADSDEMLKNLEQYNDNLALITECMTSWEQLTTNIGDIRNLMDDVIDSLEDGFDDLVEALENDLRDRDDGDDDDDDDDDSSHSSGTVSPGGTANNHYTGNDVNHNSDQDPNHGPGVARYARGIEKGVISASNILATPASVKRLRKLSTETFKNSGQVPIIAHEGEVVLNPEQQKKLLDNFDALRYQHINIPVSPNLSAGQSPTAATYNFGDIQMYGVQDVDGFAQSLKYNAGPIIHQVFSKR